ncbi:MAG: MOSC domain-containing protein [Chitinivibrionales bacterium]|nr:MOSC domain-containing protein [Chitinivibrionales bacterium]
MKTFQIVSLNVSHEKGTTKTPVDKIVLKENHGIVGDAHAGDWHRQVSLLAMEDIELMQRKLDTITPGDFAENITTRCIDLASLPVGTKLTIGATILEITQVGKACRKECAILEQVGDCIMPRRGIFTKVITGGEITHESTGTYYI